MSQITILRELPIIYYIFKLYIYQIKINKLVTDNVN